MWVLVNVTGREREWWVRSVMKVVDRKESEELLKILNVCFHL
jgi:hypothetical protein